MTNNGNELTRLFEVPLSNAERVRARSVPFFAVSTFLHGFGIALISYVLLHYPVIVHKPMDRHYRARHLEFQMPETAAARAAEAMYPTRNPAPQNKRNPTPKGPAAAAGERIAQPQPRPRAVPALSLPDGGSGKQTLVQPEITPQQTLAQKTPIPTVMVWKPQAKPVLKIVPPAPDPATADAQPAIKIPNQETKLANLPVSATPKVTLAPAPPVGTTSPVAVKTPSTVKAPPATISAPNDQPTPAAVLSASDLRMNMGTVILPQINETLGTDHKVGGAPQAGATLGAGAPQQTGAAPGAHVDTAGAGGGTAGPSQAEGRAKLSDAKKVTEPASGGGDTGKQFPGETAEHIQLPKDGKFGVIVVGSDLSDRYPETLQIWADRVAYTAYLHVGTPKAWILQYAQLRVANEASGGAVARLEAPWPYDIQRPNLLAKDLNSDALMVHGVLNESGRLENIAVAYPEGYAHSSFVLRELAQWLFRPALQLGKPTAVEILLIIPEDVD